MIKTRLTSTPKQEVHQVLVVAKVVAGSHPISGCSALQSDSVV